MRSCMIPFYRAIHLNEATPLPYLIRPAGVSQNTSNASTDRRLNPFFIRSVGVSTGLGRHSCGTSS